MAIGDKKSLPLAVCDKVPDENGNILLNTEDIEGLLEALLNKVDGLIGEFGQPLDKLRPFGFYQITNPTSGFPPGYTSDSHFSLYVTGNDPNWSPWLLMDLRTEATFRGGYTGGQFRTWLPLATSTPPEEHDLPLAEGVTRGRGCVYSKAQNGLVIVRFSAIFPAATSRTQTISTLPAGYRPSEATSGTGKVGHASGDTASAASVELWEDGRLTVYGNTTGFTNANGMAVFYAV